MRHYLPLIFSIGLLSLLYGCGAKLSTAHAQYERGEYFAAATTYRKVYNKTPAKERARRGQIAFRIGECYRRLNAAPRSAAGYQNAVRYHYPDSMALFYLARAQQMQGKYKDASKNYKAFLELKPNHSPIAKNHTRIIS